jgi:NADH-quinone oxidoreductase subunit E
VHDVDKSELFTSEMREAIDAHIAKYPPEWKQSAVMPALSILQDANGGWLTTELMDDLAAYLDMPAVSVYEVASFYGMYELEPQGRHKVCVCNSISCMLNGSEELIEHVEHKLRRQGGRDHGRWAVHAQGGRVSGGLSRCAGGAVRQGLSREPDA